MKSIERKKFTVRQFGLLQAVKEGECIADVRLLRKLQKLGVVITLSETNSFYNYVFSAEAFMVEGVGTFKENYKSGQFYPFVQKQEVTLEEVFTALLTGKELHGRDFVVKDYKMFVYGLAVNPYVLLEFVNTAFDVDIQKYGAWIRLMNSLLCHDCIMKRKIAEQLGEEVILTRLNRDGVFSEREPMYWITLETVVPLLGRITEEGVKNYIDAFIKR